MARRRTLKPEERALWEAVARTLTPKHSRPGPVPEPGPGTGAELQSGLPSALGLPDPAAKQKVQPPLPVPEVRPLIAPFRLGEKLVAKSAAPVHMPPALGLRMDARTHRQMSRGKIAPEARIDLHGMTLAEAHPALIAFILRARSSGCRLVLVITGKGKAVYEPVPRPIGALRHQVPHWLRLPPLAGAVQEVAEAHLKHGGAGAFYVYLRRA